MKIQDQSRAKKIRPSEFDTFMRNGILKPTDTFASFYMSSESLALIMNGKMTNTNEKVFCYISIDYDTYASAIQQDARFEYQWQGNDFELVENGTVEYLKKKTPKGGQIFAITL